jgi:hypothetical protein
MFIEDRLRENVISYSMYDYVTGTKMGDRITRSSIRRAHDLALQHADYYLDLHLGTDYPQNGLYPSAWTAVGVGAKSGAYDPKEQVAAEGPRSEIDTGLGEDLVQGSE